MQSAFKDHSLYNKNVVFSVSNKELNDFGVKHTAITNLQKKYFSELKKSGKVHDMDEYTQIAIKCMSEAGVPLNTATEWAQLSRRSLEAIGVQQPTNLPWG